MRGIQGGWAIGVAAAMLACSPHRDYSAYDTGATTTAPPLDADVDGDATAADTAPAYPDGPYGLTRGDVFPNLTFDGYRNGVAPWTKLSMSDVYDPDGSKGIDAILLNVSAAWCPPCKAAAQVLPAFYAQEQPRGAHFMEVLAQDASTKPATQDTADAWIDEYALPFDVAVDPLQTALTTKYGFPTQYVIDPRTMIIANVLLGFTEGDPALVTDLEHVLDANGAPPPPDGGVKIPIIDSGIDAASE